MAEIGTNNRRERGKRNKPQKAVLRVDFTPMVDMNMLLITFFMFCTTLAKPSIMDLVMPTRLGDGTKVPASRSTTLILGENDKVYYFFGEPRYDDPNFLAEVKETDFSSKGLRKVLLDKNEMVVKEMQQLSLKKRNKEISEEQFKEAADEIKKSDISQAVIIKPSSKSAYINLVNALDELQICNISKYAVVNINNQDEVLVNNYSNNKSLALNSGNNNLDINSISR